MTDFSKTLVRASMIYYVMVNDNGNGRSPMEKWADHCKKLAEEEAKYTAMEDRLKDMKSGQNKWNSILKLREENEELFRRKDDEPELSTGGKSFLCKMYAAEKYGKWSAFKDKGNKYTLKGKMAEEDAITMLSRLDKMLYVKNDVRIENEWVSGVPDIIVASSYEKADKIIDIKCPYDAETFFVLLGKELNPQYWWQIQTYMWLTGAERGEVAYLLMNTPDYILNQEKQRLFDRVEAVTKEDAKYREEESVLINNLTFDDMPLPDRRISFFVERDDQMLSKIPKRVEKCREYLAEIEKMHMTPLEVLKMEESLEKEDVA